MNPDQKFQQRWEYRRKDDGADSSSEDYKSNSADESVEKKHKMVSNFILAEKDEESEKPRSQENNQLDASTVVHSQIAEGTKKRQASGKRKNAVQNKLQEHCGKKRSRKNHTQEPALLSDLKIFTESLLKELEVARDQMLLQMKEQITKLVTGKSALRTNRKKGSCLLKTDRSMHHNGNESGDHKHPGSVMNKASNVDANNRHGYLLGSRPDEQLGSSSQISSKNLGFFDRQVAQTSNVPCIPVQLHQWSNNCFNIPSQIVLENPGQGNSGFGPRINTGGRSDVLSDHFVTNTISTNINSTSSGLI